MQLSLVAPCYNEAENLPRIFARLGDVLGGRRDVEAIFVNNGSTDESASILNAELAKPENHFARVVAVPKNQGYGFGILAGLRAASGDFLAWTHADLQTDPQDVIHAWDRIRVQERPEQYFVRGRRLKRPWFDRAFTTGMGWLASAALRSPLHDVNAQPKMFPRKFLELIEAHDPPWDFSLDLYVLYLANRYGYAILEQPVDFGRRRHGQAKGGGSLAGKWRLTRRTCRYIFALRRKFRADLQRVSGACMNTQAERSGCFRSTIQREEASSSF